MDLRESQRELKMQIIPTKRCKNHAGVPRIDVLPHVKIMRRDKPEKSGIDTKTCRIRHAESKNAQVMRRDQPEK
jgi:hypothetical protein